MSSDRFEECPSCAAKPGSPRLCDSCLERRNAFYEAEEAERRAEEAKRQKESMKERLKYVATIDLIAELKRREAREKRRPKSRELVIASFAPFWAMVRDTMDAHLINGKDLPKDFENDVYTGALEAVYGPDFWEQYREWTKG